MSRILLFFFFFLLRSALVHGFGSSENARSSLFKNMLGRQYYDGRKIVVPLAENASIQLLNHWIHQAASGFMAAFASKSVQKLRVQGRQQFRRCSKLADSVVKHSICILNLMEFEKAQQARFYKYGNTKRQMPTVKFKISSHRRTYWNQKRVPAKDDRWVGAFRMARLKRAIAEQQRKLKVVNKADYRLITDKEAKTPLGLIMRGVKKVIQKLKQKKTSKSFGISFSEDCRDGVPTMNETAFRWTVTMAEMGQLAMEIRERKKFLEALKIRATSGFNISRPAESAAVELASEPAMKSRGHQVQLAPALSKLFRNGVLLALSVANRNISTMRNKTIRMASPRLFALSPDADPQNEVKLLSPSILSLHREGEGFERKLSLSSLLESLRLMNEHDQNELLELIFEASGISDTVQRIHGELKTNDDTLNTKGIDGQPLYFTKKNVTEMYGKIEAHKINTFEKLYKTLDKLQTAEMNTTGYTVLGKSQLELIYGHRSPYHHPIVLERLSKLLNRRGALQKSLETDLKKLAKSESFGLNPRKLRRRQKRFGVTLSPFLLSPFILAPGTVSQPIVLSPLVLSPVVLSPAVLGPFILSPWVFNPLILSPRVLAPFIVSPIIFSPLVLSPLALHPFILAPGVFNPFVLSPMALSPLILSPQVATPLILSPLALNPLILNPMALSPLVLSPFVLSPLVYSPQYLFALILSPNLLSPLVQSNLTLSTVILSPSALS